MSLFQSLVSGANETNPYSWKDSCRETTGEAVLGGIRDEQETDLVEESDSGVAKKRLRKTTMARDQNFLDYLLNFDLNSVSVVNTESGSMTNGATPLNINVCKNPSSSPVVCEDIYRSHAQSNMCPEYSIPVRTSCRIKVSGSCADEQSLPLEQSSESSGSQSLLIGLIHDQGLTCSPEPQVGLKKVGQIEPINEQLQLVDSLNPTLKKTDTIQLDNEKRQEDHTSLLLPTFDSNSVASKCSKTNLDDNLNSVAYGELLVGPKGNIFTELSPAELQCQSNDPDESIKQFQQKQEDEVTLCIFSHCPVLSADIHGIVCNEKPCGGRSPSRVLDTTLAGALALPASTSCEEKHLLFSKPSSKSPKDDKININSSRKSPPDGNISTVPLVPVCAKGDKAAIENVDAKSFEDSDCTVIEDQEELKSTDKDREDKTIQAKLFKVFSTYEGKRQDKQHDSCKTSKEHRGEPTESTTDPLDTEGSVSMLTDLSQKPLCLLPTPDYNQGTESARHDGLQKVVENEKPSYTAELSHYQKKRSKHKLKKHAVHADVLHAGNVYSNRILFTLDICP